MAKILLLLSLVATFSFATVVAPSTYTGKGGASSPLTTKGDLFTRSSSADAALAIGADGLVLVANSSAPTGMAWTAVSGTGDVVGPAGATDNAVCRFDGVTGKAIQNSTGTTLDDNGLLTLPSTGGLAVASGATSANTMISVRKDQNDVTRLKVMNGSAGASAVSSLQITSSADDFNINAGSSGAGGGGVTLDLSSGAGFTDGLRIIQAGAFPITLRNNGSDRITISGAGAVSIPGAITNGALTASRVMVTDGSKVLSSSTMTQTKLESLTGEQIDAFVETPSAKTYTLRGKARYAGTINKVYLKTASGTITAKLQIAGVDVTSCTAIAVSSTPSDTTCTAANTFAAGDAITLVTSSNSSAADLVVSVDVTR